MERLTLPFFLFALLTFACGPFGLSERAASPTPAEISAASLPTALPVNRATPTVLPDSPPDSEAETYYYKGVTYFAAGLTDDAITSLTQAIALAPAYGEAYQVRGDAYRQQGRFDLARADYEQVLALTTEPERRATVTASLLKIPTGTSPEPSPVPPTPPQDRPVNLELGQPFRLKVGQTARLESADFNLLFQTVLDDSRCPRQVNCAEAGQARIMVVLWLTGREPSPTELNTNPLLKQDSVPYNDFEIRLIGLEPYPETLEPKIPPESYQASLVVSLR